MHERLKLRDRNLDWRRVEGEIIILDADKSLYLAINESGADLWASLATGTSQEALVEMLVSQYGIEPEQAAEDVQRFIDGLSAQGLLEAE